MTFLFASSISQEYKESAEAMNSIELNKKDIRRKNLKEILTESYFHGASRFGNNFVA